MDQFDAEATFTVGKILFIRQVATVVNRDRREWALRRLSVVD
jgi:hypothetical protein